MFLRLFTLLVFVNELLIYVLNPLMWPKIQCSVSDRCVTLLFVADPQILGKQSANFFTIFDNDRHIRNTFSAALNRANPDGIIFLGDLMNDGSSANNQEFQDYFKRFTSIFQLNNLIPRFKNSILFIPGDNDIGGEGEDVKKDQLLRFSDTFGAARFIVIRGIKIIPVNKSTNLHPISDSDPNIENINVLVSHIPLTNFFTDFESQVIDIFQPRFIFSGHNHDFEHITSIGRTILTRNNLSHPTSHIIPIGLNQLDEIVFPSSSYRMSIHVGYGVAVFDMSKNELQYFVLWSHSRISSLNLYLAFLILSALYLMSKYIHILYSNR